MSLRKVPHVSHNINLICSSYLVGLLTKEVQGDMLIKLFHSALPVLAIKRRTHYSTGMRVGGRIAGQHEVRAIFLPTVVHQELDSFAPGDLKAFLVRKCGFAGSVCCDELW